jgi:hypothetical protein
MFDAKASPKCSTNRDGKRRGKVQFPSSNHQGRSDLKSLNIQTRDALEILWNLDFGTWNFPTNRKFREARTVRVSCSKSPGR